MLVVARALLVLSAGLYIALAVMGAVPCSSGNRGETEYARDGLTALTSTWLRNPEHGRPPCRYRQLPAGSSRPNLCR